MPTLMNTDNIGNVFFNYMTPVIKGEGVVFNKSNFDTWVETKVGSARINKSGSGWTPFRFPAPGLETKSGTPTVAPYEYDMTSAARVVMSGSASYLTLSTNNGNGTNSVTSGSSIGATGGRAVTFGVINDYSLIMVDFSNSVLSSIVRFHYIGFLRETQYTGNPYPRGLVAIYSGGTNLTATRVLLENTNSTQSLSTAANTITNPDITCSIATPGADCTDIVIRDSAAPNNAIGKLYNCISLPSACVVGGIYKNLGVDPEGSTQDKFLCVMNWGTRKLGMRIWTEGFV